ncbi:MAG: hypothetical protein NT155_04250 [Candidatus Staskawiczbacteria bacterium]|nr:hypothetical protein [Candidatus Staskawiczbacteria bacterium]
MKNFDINNRRLLYEKINAVIVKHGIQAGHGMLWQALVHLHLLEYGSDVKFPARLEQDRWWLESLNQQQAQEVVDYAQMASSVAWRHWRKKLKTTHWITDWKTRHKK